MPAMGINTSVEKTASIKLKARDTLKAKPMPNAANAVANTALNSAHIQPMTPARPNPTTLITPEIVAAQNVIATKLNSFNMKLPVMPPASPMAKTVGRNPIQFFISKNHPVCFRHKNTPAIRKESRGFVQGMRRDRSSCDKVQTRAVQAMALARGCGAVIKNVPQVATTAAAVHLGAHREQFAVVFGADGI